MEHKFLPNQYTEEYFQLIKTALEREIDPDIFYEVHHIIPKSIGGNNDADNLVKLTPKEHFIAHDLLTEMVEGANKAKMTYAFWTMANVRNLHQKYRYIPTPEEYEKAILKRRLLEVNDTTKNKISKSRKGKIAIYNQTLDKIKYVNQEEVNFYISQGFEKRGRPKTNEHKLAIKKTNLAKGIKPASIGWNKGLTKETSESVRRISKAAKNRIPHNKGKSNVDLYGKEKASELKKKNSAGRGYPIIIDNVVYASIIEASRMLKITERKAKKIGKIIK